MNLRRRGDCTRFGVSRDIFLLIKKCNKGHRSKGANLQLICQFWVLSKYLHLQIKIFTQYPKLTDELRFKFESYFYCEDILSCCK